MSNVFAVFIDVIDMKSNRIEGDTFMILNDAKVCGESVGYIK